MLRKCFLQPLPGSSRVWSVYNFISVIIYSPKCNFKPVWRRTQDDVLKDVVFHCLRLKKWKNEWRKKGEVKWHVAKYGDPYSEFNPSKYTHSSEHTHTMNTHPEQWAANAAAPGEQLEVRCLPQGSHLSRGIECGERARYSLPPPTIPAGPETRTRNLRVTSLTLYPLGN